MDKMEPTSPQPIKKPAERFESWYQGEGKDLKGHVYKVVVGNRLHFDVTNELAKKLVNLLPSFIARVERNQEVQQQESILSDILSPWNESLAKDAKLLKQEKTLSPDQVIQSANHLHESLQNRTLLDQTLEKINGIFHGSEVESATAQNISRIQEHPDVIAARISLLYTMASEIATEEDGFKTPVDCKKYFECLAELDTYQTVLLMHPESKAPLDHFQPSLDTLRSHLIGYIAKGNASKFTGEKRADFEKMKADILNTYQPVNEWKISLDPKSDQAFAKELQRLCQPSAEPAEQKRKEVEESPSKLVLGGKVSINLGSTTVQEFAKNVLQYVPSFLAHVEQGQDPKRLQEDLNKWKNALLEGTESFIEEETLTPVQIVQSASHLDAFLKNSKDLETTQDDIKKIAPDPALAAQITSDIEQIQERASGILGRISHTYNLLSEIEEKGLQTTEDYRTFAQGLLELEAYQAIFRSHPELTETLSQFYFPLEEPEERVLDYLKSRNQQEASLSNVEKTEFSSMKADLSSSIDQLEEWISASGLPSDQEFFNRLKSLVK